MDLFLTMPGQVVSFDSPGVPMSLFLDGWGGYDAFKSILTGFQVQTKSGVQYMHTMRDMIFVYTYGERITPIVLQGVSFASQCESILDQAGAGAHGLEYALAYYLNNRVSTRGLPVTMVLGLSTPFSGFLDGGNFNLVDTERVLGSFAFNFTAVPQPALLDLLV